MKLINLFFNILYPPRCIFCGKSIPPDTLKDTCAECANTLPYCRAYQRCSRCGKPMSEGSSHICRRCLTQKHYATKITSVFAYTDRAKRAVIAFKREHNAWMAGTLSIYIADMVMLDFAGVDFDAVISVPPRIKGIKESHFDQADYLAATVAERLGLPYIRRAMKQTKKLRKQSSLSYDERFNNVKGNFTVIKRNSVKGKTILLIDDVCTSGASIEECARALKDAGAFRVYAATVATVPA